MKVKDIVDELKLSEVTKLQSLDTEITGGYTSDLLSNVMGQAEPGMVWITMQAHHNIAAVGSLIGLSAIVVTGEAKVEEDTIKKAEENALAIFTTPLSSYDAAGKLYALGVKNKES